jgi:hypothetical protein
MDVVSWNRNGAKSIAERTENVTLDSFQTPLNNDVTPSRAGGSTNGLEPFQMALTYITLNYSTFALHGSSIRNSDDVYYDFVVRALWYMLAV